MFLFKTVCVLSLVFVLEAHGKITETEYASMPPLFHLDNFDSCMLLGQKALYCSITVQLSPISSENSSDVWRVIQEVISHKKNYRHDRLRHRICVPQSCPQLSKNISTYQKDAQLLNVAITECYSEKYFSLGLKGFVTDMHCETNKPSYNIDVYDIVVGIFLIFLLATVIFASFYEGVARYKTKEEYNRITKTTFGKIISCFSLPKNWQRLRSTNTSSDAVSLKCLDGMRFYTIVFVVVAHTSMGAIVGYLSNPQYAENVTDDPLNMFFINGTCIIQTFFVMSGWLLSYNSFLSFKNRKEVKFDYILIKFVNRYIRLTPCLLVMIAINSTWVHHLGRGPLWDKLVESEYHYCRENWWTNLLYINNYYNADRMCLAESWYLAADTQLYLYSLIITLFMWRYQKYIKYILGTCLSVGILIPGVINYIYDYDIVIRHHPERLQTGLIDLQQWQRIFASGYTHIGGYTIGLISGYIFYKYKEEKIFASKLRVVMWWILVWGLSITVIFVGIPLYEENYESSRLGAAIYVALGRNIFAFAIALLIFGLAQGVGWFLRDAITWTPLQVLGKLTYCVYLVHVTLIRARIGQDRSPFYMSSYTILNQTLADLAMSYIVATLLYLFVEMPFFGLQKLLLPQYETKKNRDLPGKLTNGVTEGTPNSRNETSRI